MEEPTRGGWVAAYDNAGCVGWLYPKVVGNTLEVAKPGESQGVWRDADEGDPAPLRADEKLGWGADVALAAGVERDA